MPLASWLREVELHPALATDIEARFASVPQQEPSVVADAVGRIEAGARQCVAPSARAHPFGSTVNGFGEASSDLDVILSIDVDELRYYMSYYEWLRKEQRYSQLLRRRSTGKQLWDAAVVKLPKLVSVDERGAIACAVQQLTEVLPEYGFKVLRSLPRARRPLVTLRDRTGELDECDVSINNHLPLSNSDLLRSYSLLDKRARPLVLFTKAWAKGHRVCGANEGNLSSYAWTIMAIYFLQLVNVLPSLQMLAEEPKSVTDSDYWSYTREFDTSFLPAEEYLRRQQSKEAAPLAANSQWSLSDLVYGFFRFFGREYRWGSEVVSIRRPERRAADAWWRLYGKLHPEPGIHVEDPIELRDLNIVLRRDRLAQLKAELGCAVDLLERGGGLEELLATEERASPEDPAALTLPPRPPQVWKAPKRPRPFVQRRAISEPGPLRRGQ